MRAAAAERRMIARNHVRMKSFLRRRGQPTGGPDSVLTQRVLSLAEARLARLGEKPSEDGGMAAPSSAKEKDRTARQAQINLAAAGSRSSRG